MENPASMVRRAALSRRRRNLPAAPVPASAQPPQPSPPAAPRHTSSHASYTALMRSHDRVSTRHIAPRGGA